MILAWTIFYNPLPMGSGTVLWMVLPLCAAVSLVYKTLRVRDIRRLPLVAAGLFLYIAAGLTALGGGLWILVRYWPR